MERTAKIQIRTLKTWFRLGGDTDPGQPPKFLFWFVAMNMALALLYEVVVYVPLSSSLGSAGAGGALVVQGRLNEYLGMHYVTIACFILTWIFFIMVHITDPGLLAKKHFANVSNNTSGITMTMGMDTCMDAGARNMNILCLNENKRIKREMHTLTNDLRNLYKETLESFATSDSNSAAQSANANPDDDRLLLCHSCHIAKSLQLKHCRVLNHCVLLFDHHCPFVGTTIGLYNYRYFYFFIIFFTLTNFLFSFTGIMYLKHAPQETRLEMGKLLVILYFFAYSIMTFALCVYHTQLIAKNLTTNEHQNRFKYSYLKDENGTYCNPFDQGLCKNFMSRMFPGKDLYVLALARGLDVEDERSSRRGIGGSRGLSIWRSLSSSGSVEDGLRNVNVNANVKVNDKKDEEKLSLVQNIV